MRAERQGAILAEILAEIGACAERQGAILAEILAEIGTCAERRDPRPASPCPRGRDEHTLSTWQR